MLDLEKIKKVYVIGIKGSGIIAIVEILHSMGIEISGSDKDEKFFTDEILQRLGIKYKEFFSIDNIPEDTDLIIYSSSYNESSNVEIAETKRKGLKMMSYPEVLAELFNQKYGIAVTGTHGKTTTSAMLANTLKELGEDPKAVIGSKVLNWNGNALNGKGKYFVIEADEFQNKLKMYDPKVVLLTNLDWDHPDTYPTFEDYKKAFEDFVLRIPEAGLLVCCGDDKDVLEVSKETKCEVLTYGFSENCDYFISEVKNKNFSAEFKGEKLGNFEIQLIGKHNVLNAASVVATCHRLNFDVENIRGALKSFKGTKRRFEYIGQRNGAILIDDYGHHPEEIRATLKGAREIYPEKKITAIFHPHSYSRTEALLKDFSQSFDDADKVIVLDIYGSVREGSGQVNSKDLANLINEHNPGKAQYLATIPETVDFLKNKVSEKDVILCIGAGNVFEVAENLKELRN